MNKWRTPANADEQNYTPEKGVKIPVKELRSHTVEIQVKNNPFVKKVPTTVYWYLIEKSSSKVVIRTLTKNTDIPFCESFNIEMETTVVGFDKPNAQCCVLRTTN